MHDCDGDDEERIHNGNDDCDGDDDKHIRDGDDDDEERIHDGHDDCDEIIGIRNCFTVGV